MDNHEEEKESLIEKSHAAGGGANLTAGLNAPNCRGKIVAAKTQDEQAAMDKYGITFDGETYNVDGRKFVALSYAIKCADPNACIPKPAKPATPKSWWDYIKISGLVLGTLALGGALLFFYASLAVLALGFIIVALTRNWKD